MKNFLRAIKFALRYRWRLVISVVCAFVAAILFGLNFSAVYPLLQMMMTDRNLQQWIDAKMKDVEEDIAQKEKELDLLSEKKRRIDTLPPGKLRDNESHNVTEELGTKEGRLATSRARQWRYQLVKHHVIRHLPTDNFWLTTSSSGSVW